MFSTSVPVVRGNVVAGGGSAMNPTMLAYLNGGHTRSITTHLKDMVFCATTPITGAGPKDTVKCINSRLENLETHSQSLWVV